MVRLTLRLPEDISEKLRWLAYRDRRSQHSILLEIIEKALTKVHVTREDKS